MGCCCSKKWPVMWDKKRSTLTSCSDSVKLEDASVFTTPENNYSPRSQVSLKRYFSSRKILDDDAKSTKTS